MNIQDIADLRLASQHIAGTKFTSAGELVTWMGALQAQDYAMSKWAVGVRLSNSTNKSIEAAMDKGEIIRTHVLRPTWHLVAAGDVRWMIQLTAPHIKKMVKGRHADLKLTEAVLSKSRKVLEKILRDGNYSTREELIVGFNKAGIATDENRASHIFLAAELEGLICSGPTTGGKQNFGLLDERVPPTKLLSRDEALRSLAKRYFSSHGPATLDDFAWWSGLPAGDAKRALEMVKSGFESETIEGKPYWLAEANVRIKESAFLLPAYDEFIISYKDRSATITFDNTKRAVSSNGIFRPVIVVNGQTVGIWKRSIKKDKAIIEMEYFTRPGKAALKMIDEASVRYGLFLEKKIELH
jgi:hypothetical protein